MTDNIPVELTESAQLQITKAEEALSRATAITVKTETDYNEAGDFIADLKSYKNALEKERKDITGPLDQAKKKIMAKFRPHVDNIDQAIRAINNKMTAYYREQETKRLKAEAEAAEKARKERERLEDRARKASEKGQEEKAEALREQQANVAAKPVAPTANKQTGSTTVVTTYKAEVFDKLSLIEAIAKGEQSMELVEINHVALNKMAAAQKDSLQVPGVRVRKEQSVRRK